MAKVLRLLISLSLALVAAAKFGDSIGKGIQNAKGNYSSSDNGPRSLDQTLQLRYIIFFFCRKNLELAK